jgi:hypothetical protein
MALRSGAGVVHPIIRDFASRPHLPLDVRFLSSKATDAGFAAKRREGPLSDIAKE